MHQRRPPAGLVLEMMQLLMLVLMLLLVLLLVLLVLVLVLLVVVLAAGGHHAEHAGEARVPGGAGGAGLGEVTGEHAQLVLGRDVGQLVEALLARALRLGGFFFYISGLCFWFLCFIGDLWEWGEWVV